MQKLKIIKLYKDSLYVNKKIKTLKYTHTSHKNFINNI